MFREQVSVYMMKKYPNFIKTSWRPSKPHINLEFFTTSLDFIVRKYNITDYYQMIYFIECTNQITTDIFQSMITTNCLSEQDKKLVQQIAAKTTTIPFYLGMIKEEKFLSFDVNMSLMDDIFRQEVDFVLRVEDVEMKDCSKRVKIPKALKDAVWDANIGSDKANGLCACCKKQIHIRSFDCGHKISVIHGGATSLENLIPLCVTCNRSMGEMDLTEFMHKFGFTDGGGGV